MSLVTPDKGLWRLARGEQRELGTLSDYHCCLPSILCTAQHLFEAGRNCKNSEEGSRDAEMGNDASETP